MYTVVFFVGVQYCSSVQPVVAVEMAVFYREKGAGMYSGMPYPIFSLVERNCVSLLMHFIFLFRWLWSRYLIFFFVSVVYGVIVYAMIGFEWTAAKFFWYLFVMFFTLLHFTFYGMMIVAITPNHHISAIVSILFYGLWNVFSGFVIPRPVSIVFTIFIFDSRFHSLPKIL